MAEGGSMSLRRTLATQRTGAGVTAWDSCRQLPRACVPTLKAAGEEAAIGCVLNASAARLRQWVQRAEEAGTACARALNGSACLPKDVCAPAQFASQSLPALTPPTLPTFRRWHTQTQERLFGHLRAVWADNIPRVMVDLGSHAGHGPNRDLSDALLWLQYFNSSGSLVLGVDAFEDYALDLQHRFDEVEPFASLRGVSKRALHVAIARKDGGSMEMSFLARMAITCCAGAWCGWKKQELRGDADHYCRITRQRVGPCKTCGGLVNASGLPTPPSSYSMDIYKAVLAGPSGERTLPGGRLLYNVRTMRLDTLWRTELASRRIDMLKIDIDTSWRDLGGLPALLAGRALRVLVCEVDESWLRFWGTERRGKSPPAARWNLSQADELMWLGRQHGYASFLKVPCRAKDVKLLRQADLFASAWYFPLSAPGRPFVPSGFTSERHGIQDLLLLDAHDPALARLPELGHASCADAPPALGHHAHRGGGRAGGIRRRRGATQPIQEPTP